MPNPVSPILRACLLAPLGLCIQAAQAEAANSNATGRGVMAISVQVVATCVATASQGIAMAASCQDRTPFVVSREVTLTEAAPGFRIVTIRY